MLVANVSQRDVIKLEAVKADAHPIDVTRPYRKWKMPFSSSSRHWLTVPSAIAMRAALISCGVNSVMLYLQWAWRIHCTENLG